MASFESPTYKSPSVAFMFLPNSITNFHCIVRTSPLDTGMQTSHSARKRRVWDTCTIKV